MNAITTTGAELRHFLADMRRAHGSIDISSDPGAALDVMVNGVRALSVVDLEQAPPDAKVNISGYILCGQQRNYWRLQRVFREWQKGRFAVSRAVMVPRDKMAEFEQLVKALGGTFVS